MTAFWPSVSCDDKEGGPPAPPATTPLLTVPTLLYLVGIIDWRIFFSGCRRIMYNLGVKRHSRVTVALRDMETDRVVMFSAMWLLCEELKYRGTKASQMMHVVYMVKPMNFDSLKASGILRVSTA